MISAGRDAKGVCGSLSGGAKAYCERVVRECDVPAGGKYKLTSCGGRSMEVPTYDACVDTAPFFVGMFNDCPEQPAPVSPPAPAQQPPIGSYQPTDSAAACRGTSGEQNAQCRQIVRDCDTQRAQGRPYQYQTCSGVVFSFANHAACVNAAPNLVHLFGPCPKPQPKPARPPRVPLVNPLEEGPDVRPPRIPVQNGEIHRGRFVINRAHGIKVAKGVYIGQHMEADSRRDLVARYKLHRRALINMIEYGDPKVETSDKMPREFVDLVRDFNASWTVQENTHDTTIDFGPLEAKLARMLDLVVPRAKEENLAAVGREVGRFTSLAEKGGTFVHGLDEYLRFAREGTVTAMGLAGYLRLAKEGNATRLGLDGYIHVAKSGTARALGLDGYIRLADGGDVSSGGYNDYVERAGGPREGIKYVGANSSLAPEGKWEELVRDYQVFVETFTGSRREFERQMTAEFLSFQQDVTTRHKVFADVINAAHVTAGVQMGAEFAEFKAATGNEDTIARGVIQEAADEAVNATGGYALLKAYDGKISTFEGAVTELVKKMGKRHEGYIRAMDKLHTDLTTSFGEEYKLYSEYLEVRYPVYAGKIKAIFDAYREFMAEKYRGILDRFKQFMKDYPKEG